MYSTDFKKEELDMFIDGIRMSKSIKWQAVCMV